MSNGACDFFTLSRLDSADAADEDFYNNDIGEGEALWCLLSWARLFLKALSVKSSANCGSGRSQGLFTGKTDAIKWHESKHICKWEFGEFIYFMFEYFFD